MSRAEVARSTVRRAFNWMAAGLATSGIIAYLVSTSPYALSLVLNNPIIFFGLVIAQLALVVVLSAFVHKLEYSTAALLFMGYASLTGLTLSTLFLMYQMTSLVSVFFITAGMFALSALYGATTTYNLMSLGRILTTMLIGILLALVVNMFLQSGSFDLMISIGAVVVFTLLIAYDTQMLMAYADRAADHPQFAGLFAIRMALALYLDFVNLFIYLLRLFGQRRQS
jgi:FtsH-binding integral membrane protein